MNLSTPLPESIGSKKSFLWIALAAGCFHAAYTSIKFPSLGLFIFGYAYFLVRLTDQPNVRRAFYLGLATGFLCAAPQLFFFWNIFGVAAIVLWLVFAFWIGLFTATVCGAFRRWGKRKAMWLVPFIWTGIEYFRSELYYLKFSWLNVGYALPEPLVSIGKIFFRMGMYGDGFLIFALVIGLTFHGRNVWNYFFRKMTLIKLLLVVFVTGILLAMLATSLAGPRTRLKSVSLAGIQMEFPPEHLIPKILDQALAKNTNAQIFVMSEYSLDGGVPALLTNSCRDNARFLIIGGKDVVTNEVYFNTAFVVGTNGEIVFQQAKSVPIQFFKDGLPATKQEVWNSPWGKIGICICYDLSYTRVTDELIRQGAQLLIVPTMDVEGWGRHQHELHSRVAPVRAAEYGVPIFRVASSGISQAVTGHGSVVAQTQMPGSGEIFSAQLRLPRRGELPLDRILAPLCTGLTGVVMAWLLLLEWKDRRAFKNIHHTSTGP